MSLTDGIKISDHVVAQMVDCTPQVQPMTEVERAFRQGYRAARDLNYPGQIGAEEKAWEAYVSGVTKSE